MYKAAVSLLLMAAACICNGQQLPRYSQYMNTMVVLNPAVTGSQKYMEIGLLYRSQWVGFDGSPKTQLLTVHSSIDKKKYGLGGYVFNDQSGPIKNTGINLSYAYHLPINKEVHFSLGLSGSIGMFGIDGTMMVLSNENDNLVNSKMGSRKAVADAAFGALIYSKLYYVGISVLHLPETNYKLFDGISAMKQERHYYLIGGYILKVNEKYSIRPNAYINYMVNNPMQADINLMLNYDDLVGFGTSYRTKDAVTLIFELSVIEYLKISYSYDILVSPLNKHNAGSHELMVNYRYYYNPQYKSTKARYKIRKIKKKDETPDE